MLAPQLFENVGVRARCHEPFLRTRCADDETSIDVAWASYSRYLPIFDGRSGRQMRPACIPCDIEAMIQWRGVQRFG